MPVALVTRAIVAHAKRMSPDSLLAVARKQRTLEEVTRWALARGFAIAEVVTQDEYTHDVVVAADGSFLVYDTT